MKFTCQKCTREFNMEANDANIKYHPCFGYTRLHISVKCPYCGTENRVAETPEAHELLDSRIEKRDFDTSAETTAIDEAVYESLTECGD